MMQALLKQQIQHSPAFVLDMDQVRANLQPLRYLQQATGCKVLYSMKALPLASLLSALKPHVDGISVSSLFEARLASELLGQQGDLHLTTPGLRADEFAEVAALCSHISFNSLSQYQRLGDFASGYSRGLRINPKLSFAADQRYDPCRMHSKLGVDIALLTEELPEGIEGLQFHTAFSQTELQPLLRTLKRLEPLLHRHAKLKWLNLGGGYLYHSIADLQVLRDAIRQIKATFAEDVYLEPGKALVGNAGYLTTTVLDRFDSDGKPVLVLDTSVNHHPKIFEYQLKPALHQEVPNGMCSAILAGSSCLAGDVFGEYRFERIPSIGEKLFFKDVGAYSLIKASRFNGYALPAIYLWRDGRPVLLRADDYQDYRRQWGI